MKTTYQNQIIPVCNRLKKLVVKSEQNGLRLDKILSLELREENLSRTNIGHYIRNGQVLVNDIDCTKPSLKLQTGDIIKFYHDQSQPGVLPVSGHLNIVWQDDQFLVLNKPAGLSVHPVSPSQEHTLVNYLVHLYPQLRDMDNLRPGIVHRLDKDTSGLMLVALNKGVQEELVQQFANRKVQKEYLCLVVGKPEPTEGQINLSLGKDPVKKTKMAVLPDNGKEAKTLYSLRQIFRQGQYSLLQVKILTGRTHQIRVHLAQIGHSVLGDNIYGSTQQKVGMKKSPILSSLVDRQMLHSWKLSLKHPYSQKNLFWQQPVPKDFLRNLLYLNRIAQKVVITGTLGCGKSALTKQVAKGEIPVWSADKAVEDLYQPFQDGWEMLRRSFGDRYLLHPQGPVDKKKLFQEMQDVANLRQEIQDLIHPLVKSHMDCFLHRHKDKRLVLLEIPLLFETGWEKNEDFDLVVSVFCPQKSRWDRLEKQRGLTQEQIKKMESWQLREEDKLIRSDLIVDNSGDWQQLESKANRLAGILRYLRRKKVRDFWNKLKTDGVI